MINKLQSLFLTIFLTFVEFAYSSGVLQFSSGFEDNVTINSRNIMTGIDQSAPAGINNWDDLTDYLPWMKQP